MPLPSADMTGGSSSQAQGFLRALSSRNYRLFFIGNGVSLIGTWMTNVATAWMVFRLARAVDPAMAPVWLGYIAFASQAPTF